MGSLPVLADWDACLPSCLPLLERLADAPQPAIVLRECPGSLVMLLVSDAKAVMPRGRLQVYFLCRCLQRLASDRALISRGEQMRFMRSPWPRSVMWEEGLRSCSFIKTSLRRSLHALP